MPNSKPRQPRRWTTDKQRAAARRNGAKSKGPTTPAGKSRSSRNNLSLGLHTQTLDLSTDPTYEATFRDLVNRFLLPDHSNLADVEAIVSAALRRRKLYDMEARLFNANYDPSNAHSLNPIARELYDIAQAESRESTLFIRLARRMEKRKSNSNPTNTQLNSSLQHIKNSAAHDPELFHNPDSIIKSYD